MKPEFVKYLQQDSILIVDCDTKKKVLDAIVAHACTRCTMDEDQIREAILKRERMMTTGVGKGLALPHIRISGFPSPLVIVVVCRNPITDYKTLGRRTRSGSLSEAPRQHLLPSQRRQRHPQHPRCRRRPQENLRNPLCGMTVPDRIPGPKAVVPADFSGSLPVFGTSVPVRRRMFFAGSGGLRRFRARAENSAASVRNTMLRPGVSGPGNNSRSDPASRKAGLHGQKKTFQSD